MTRPTNNDWRVQGLAGADNTQPDTLTERIFQGVGYPLRAVDNVPATTDPEIPPDAIAPAVGLSWAGEFSPGLWYPKGSLVRDGAFLALATKWTQNKPAPIPAGTAEYAAPTFAPTTQSNASIVTCTHRYVTSQALWVQRLRVFTPTFSTDYRFRVVITIDPDGASPTHRVLEPGFLSANGWTTITSENLFIPAATTFEVSLETLNSSASSGFSGSWSFGGLSSSPPAVSGWNRNDPNTQLRFNLFDNAGANRQADLMSAVMGTTVTLTDSVNLGNSVTYLITDDPVLDAANSQVVISGELQGVVGTGVSAGNLSLATFSIPTTSTAEYSEQTTFWGTEPTSSWLTVTSRLAYDGVDQAAPSDTCYGIDVLTGPVNFSNDWSIIATNAFNGPATPIFASGLWGI